MSADNERIVVHLPNEHPVLTKEVSQILLAILIDLTTVEVQDGPPEGTS
jgi:hypothetical protein